MPNPYHLRARVDRLWRHANSDAPAYRRLKSLNAVVRELFAPTERARQNHQLYLATDPYDVARHHLRDLYDHASPAWQDPAPATTEVAPATTAVAPAQAGAAPLVDESSDEDDDPL
ncbi:MAG: hypothetical protein OXI41_10015 [Chloroflexota bacterium]|nr:hypothetical protein [Chloroflexota bacterium]MDE2894181.1 hypothetical protein [Chloroflexota bacterium]